MSEKDEKNIEEQAGFKPNRSCISHVCAHIRGGKVIQGRRDAGLTTYCFFLYVHKTYDIVWRNGLWKNMWVG